MTRKVALLKGTITADKWRPFQTPLKPWGPSLCGDVDTNEIIPTVEPSLLEAINVKVFHWVVTKFAMHSFHKGHEATVAMSPVGLVKPRENTANIPDFVHNTIFRCRYVRLHRCWATDESLLSTLRDTHLGRWNPSLVGTAAYNSGTKVFSESLSEERKRHAENDFHSGWCAFDAWPFEWSPSTLGRSQEAVGEQHILPDSAHTLPGKTHCVRD